MADLPYLTVDGAATLGEGTRVGREALVRRIGRALDAGPVLLVAGAGWGKTMAVEEALADRSAQSAWIRCSDADRDAGRLLRRVVSALQVAVPGAVDVLAERMASAGEQIDVPAILDELLEEVERLLVEDVVLVFDDAEHLQSSSHATTLVEKLLTAHAAALRIVVATRRPLPVRVAKLRAAGRLTEFGAGDLAFGVEECEELLCLKGARDESDVARLFAATDGWPLGVALGAAHGAVRPLEGSSRAAVFEFLHEELLDSLPSDLRTHVIDAAVVGVLTPVTMSALGLPEDFPDRVARVGLPLRAPASDPDALAFHPLLREFLLERLAVERTPEARRALHASVASTECGEEAVEHWLAAEAWPQAAEAIGGVGASLVHCAPATVRRWLEALPAEAREIPSCLLLEGMLNWGEGRLAEAIVPLRAAAAGFARDTNVLGEWLARFALADPLCVLGEWEAAIALADGFDDPPALAAGLVPAAVAAYATGALGALGRTAESEALSRRLLAHPHLGVFAAVRPLWEIHALLLSGELDKLIDGADHAVGEFERFDPVNRLPILVQLRAVALAHEGRGAQELAAWERVESTARAAHMHHVVKLSHASRAFLHAREGRRESAEEQMALAGSLRRAGGWSEYTLETARALIAGLRGEAHEAVAAAESALALLERAPLTDRVHAVIELAPLLHRAGVPGRARSLVESQLAIGAAGSYFRSLLLVVRAWLRDADGEAAAAIEDLELAWATAGPNVAHLARRVWRLLEPLVGRALDHGSLDPDAVISAVEAALPGSEALLAFTAHPDPRVRRASIAPAAAAGRPDLVERIRELAGDTDPQVAAAAGSAARRLCADPPPLSFTLFGGFTVRRGHWTVDDAAWDRRVAQRLVRYLLIHRGSAVPDDLLLEAFWPDKPVDPARKSLRVAVSCARSVLDVPGATSVIEVAEGMLRVRLRERDCVDVDRFERAATTALAVRPQDRRRLLEHAAALWTGEPLPEERYEPWASPWREHLSRRYGQVLTELVRAARADDDHLAATDAAHKLVRLEPLCESAHRELIVSYARSGRRAHALRQYLECRRTLIDRLGVEPSVDTRELQRRILAGDLV